MELLLDFDDSLVIATMADLEISNLVTFDKHFDDIKGIEVLNPLKALNILEGERI
jgi:predicted nucleic acid-binding protein